MMKDTCALLVSLGNRRLPVCVWKWRVLVRTGSFVSLYSSTDGGFMAVRAVTYTPTATFIPSPKDSISLRGE